MIVNVVDAWLGQLEGCKETNRPLLFAKHLHFGARGAAAERTWVAPVAAPARATRPPRAADDWTPLVLLRAAAAAADVNGPMVEGEGGKKQKRELKKRESERERERALRREDKRKESDPKKRLSRATERAVAVAVVTTESGARTRLKGRNWLTLRLRNSKRRVLPLRRRLLGIQHFWTLCKRGERSSKVFENEIHVFYREYKMPFFA